MPGTLSARSHQVSSRRADSKGKDKQSYFRATRGKNMFQRFMTKVRTVQAQSRAADRRLAEATAHAWLVLAQVEQERTTTGGHR